MDLVHVQQVLRQVAGRIGHQRNRPLAVFHDLDLPEHVVRLLERAPPEGFEPGKQAGGLVRMDMDPRMPRDPSHDDRITESRQAGSQGLRVGSSIPQDEGLRAVAELRKAKVHVRM
jgi:hypothetical protein